GLRGVLAFGVGRAEHLTARTQALPLSAGVESRIDALPRGDAARMTPDHGQSQRLDLAVGVEPNPDRLAFVQATAGVVASADDPAVERDVREDVVGVALGELRGAQVVGAVDGMQE